MTFARYPSLQGKSVIVTGGASGMGEATVRAFAEQGARVGFVDGGRAGGPSGAGVIWGWPVPAGGSGTSRIPPPMLKRRIRP
jgi:hypothetical protein